MSSLNTIYVYIKVTNVAQKQTPISSHIPFTVSILMFSALLLHVLRLTFAWWNLNLVFSYNRWPALWYSISCTLACIWWFSKLLLSMETVKFESVKLIALCALSFLPFQHLKSVNLFFKVISYCKRRELAADREGSWRNDEIMLWAIT